MADELTRSGRYNAAKELYSLCLKRQEKIVVGFFAIVGALAVAFAWLQEHQDARGLSWLPPALAIPLGWLLWFLYARNQENYLDCGKAAKELENPGGGVFSTLYPPPPQPQPPESQPQPDTPRRWQRLRQPCGLPSPGW